MKSHRVVKELLTTLVIAFLPFAGIPVGAAESTARLNGSIVHSDLDAPLAGARLHAGDPKTGRIFSSTPAREDGSFDLSELPPSTYTLAVESQGGLYVVEAPLSLAPGMTRTLNVAVSPQAVHPDKKAKGGEAGKWGFWENPLVATLTFLGIATVVGVLIDDDSSSGVQSPSMP